MTEKLWKVLNYYIIPVVLGGANYSEFAPEKSFIDVRDFESVEKVSEYLLYLDKNETAYAEYFEWKNYFSISDNSDDVFCQLCQALHEDATPKVYQDLHQWWQTDANCQRAGTFPWSQKSGPQNSGPQNSGPTGKKHKFKHGFNFLLGFVFVLILLCCALVIVACWHCCSCS